MQIDRQNGMLFFRLYQTLMFFVNQRVNLIPSGFTKPEEYNAHSPQARSKILDAWLANPDFLDSFVTENPARLPKAELDIVSSWRHYISGKFYFYRQLKKYAVFLSTTEPAVVYGVLALEQPFEKLVGPYQPILIETVLLPFKDKITYCGLISRYDISFGSGVRRTLAETYNEAKINYGIVTSLPRTDKPVPLTTKTSRPKLHLKTKTPDDSVAEALKIIIGFTDHFCKDFLNEEYAVLCRNLAEKLARKRPSPLSSGKPVTWACGIVRTIGWVNFLDDKSQNPHMKLTTIDKMFGIGESTGQSKSMAIRRLIKIKHMDPAWTLPSRMEQNPRAWLVEINGFVLDARHLSRELQEEALRNGLIPYIPEKQPRSEVDNV